MSEKEKENYKVIPQNRPHDEGMETLSNLPPAPGKEASSWTHPGRPRAQHEARAALLHSRSTLPSLAECPAPSRAQRTVGPWYLVVHPLHILDSLSSPCSQRGLARCRLMTSPPHTLLP